MIITENTTGAIASKILWLHKDVPFLNWTTLLNENDGIFPANIDYAEKNNILDRIKNKFKEQGIIDFQTEKDAITWMTEYGYKLRSLPQD